MQKSRPRSPRDEENQREALAAIEEQREAILDGRFIHSVGIDPTRSAECWAWLQAFTLTIYSLLRARRMGKLTLIATYTEQKEQTNG